MAETYIYQGAINKLSEILNQLHSEKIFLVSGKSSFQKSGASQLISKLLKNFELVHFDNFTTNPNLSDVKAGIDKYKQTECDTIISVGGGSVIDMAKLINYFQSIPNYQKLTEQTICNAKFEPLKHICIPTTAGSGSEATQFAVMYIDKKKFSIDHDQLAPDFVLIDTDLLKSQSSYQVSVSGIDAFSQAIESYWSVNSTEQSRDYASKAIGLIWNNLEMAVNNNETAMCNMAKASNLAGKAINITRTTAPHAISYGFTANFGIPHGHATAITLPFFLKYNFEVSTNNLNDPRGIDFVVARINEIISLLGANNIDDAYSRITQFIQRLHLPISMVDLNITKDDVVFVLSQINLQRLKNNPRLLKIDDLKTYFLSQYNY